MRLAAVITGGKDSIYAAYLASKENDVAYVISLISDGFFSEPNSHVVRQQAALMGIPLIEKKTDRGREFEDLEEVLNSIRGEIDGVVVGSIASNTKKMEVDALCKRLELLPIAPLWHTDPPEYMKDMISEGFDIIFVAARSPLTKEWLGRRLDEKAIDELQILSKKHGINVGGEGGEYETFVINCPMFLRKIDIVWAEPKWDGRSGVYDIKKTEYVAKE